MISKLSPLYTSKFSHIPRILSKSHRAMFSLSSFPSDMKDLLRAIVPPLSHQQHKGQMGRIGVLGGSPDYAGAPYFAAISAMRTGADLASVFCPAEETSPVIKSYSPELIVHTLNVKNGGSAKDHIISHLERLHALVIGPGLGRDWVVGQDIVRPVIQKARELSLPLVIDADGLAFITAHPEDIQGYPLAILTPNAVEFDRLFDKIKPQVESDNDPDPLPAFVKKQKTLALSKALGNVTIVHKGAEDVITDGRRMLCSDAAGSKRRCGGQGDVLAGTVALFAHWAFLYEKEVNPRNRVFEEYGAPLSAGYCASALTRLCSEEAFSAHGRSMLTTDMIKFIPAVFQKYFES